MSRLVRWRWRKARSVPPPQAHWARESPALSSSRVACASQGSQGGSEAALEAVEGGNVEAEESNQAPFDVGDGETDIFGKRPQPRSRHFEQRLPQARAFRAPGSSPAQYFGKPFRKQCPITGRTMQRIPLQGAAVCHVLPSPFTMQHRSPYTPKFETSDEETNIRRA